MRRLLAIAAGAGLLLVVGGAAPVNAAAAGVYADYSMMFAGPNGFAGQWWTAGSSPAAAAQYAWHHTSATHADIDWGDPANWPKGSGGAPGDLEYFDVAGDWVTVSGWSATDDGQNSNGVDYVQVVTSETYDPGCTGNTIGVTPAGGRERYARNQVTSQTYCLDASGYIEQFVNGVQTPSVHITFRHWQQWSLGSCPNPFQGTAANCLVQHERWWDDNGHAYQQTLDRTEGMAAGQGWYYTDNNDFHAYERWSWTW